MAGLVLHVIMLSMILKPVPVDAINCIARIFLIFGFGVDGDLLYFTVTIILLALGTAWNHFKFDFFKLFDLEAQALARPFLITLNVVFETCSGFAYIFGFTLLFQKSM